MVGNQSSGISFGSPLRTWLGAWRGPWLGVLAVSLIAGCGPKPAAVSATSTTPPAGQCNCVCPSMSNVQNVTWNNHYSSAPDADACAQNCGEFSTRYTACDPYFTPAPVLPSAYKEPADRRSLAVEAPETPQRDQDGDGVPDERDRCPKVAGPAANDGCPDEDRDHDTVPDRLDKCPDTAGLASNDGCPDLDSDHDGIPDRRDQCPNEPETRNGYQDQDGCPDQLPSVLQKFSGAIEGIVFKTGSAEIDKRSDVTLANVVKALKEFADTRVEITGHTDNVGKEAANTKLSDDRARSVKAWLVGHGIAAERLDAQGFGPTRPIADNSTAAGRSKNRRVEFKLLSGALQK